MFYFELSEYALKKKESYWLTQTIIAHRSGSAGCWKTLGLAALSLRWQILGQFSKLGRVSRSVNPALDVAASTKLKHRVSRL